MASAADYVKPTPIWQPWNVPMKRPKEPSIVFLRQAIRKHTNALFMNYMNLQYSVYLDGSIKNDLRKECHGRPNYLGG
jgi:hypothetical protein